MPGRNRLNHSDEFYQIRAHLHEQYWRKSNLNHLLEQRFNDDLDDYKTTRTLLQNHKERHAKEHHEIDTSTLRLDDQQSRSRRPHSVSSKHKQTSLKKGFLRSSSSTLNVRPTIQPYDFDNTTASTDKDSLAKVDMANKQRLLLGNEHEIVQVLNEHFPGIYVSNETQTKLNEQFSKHMDSVFKARMELLSAQQGTTNDVSKDDRYTGRHSSGTRVFFSSVSSSKRPNGSTIKQRTFSAKNWVSYNVR